MATMTCVGIATLDRVYQVAVHPTGPGKYRASERRVVGGGVAANGAVTAARLGADVRFVGVLGDDGTGDAILAGLADEGLDVSGVQRIGGASSPESAVLVDRAGERLIVNHASAGLFDRAAAPSIDSSTGMDAVLVDMRWPVGAIAALEAARVAGIPGIVDCDHDPVDAPGILEAASHVVFAVDTLRRWVGIEGVDGAVRAAADRLGCWVAATAGEHGTWFSDGTTSGHQPAVPVDAVDTLGAGDTFHGAFAVALAEARPVGDALAWASAAAALKCTRFGGRDGIPTRLELDRFISERSLP